MPQGRFGQQRTIDGEFFRSTDPAQQNMAVTPIGGNLLLGDRIIAGKIRQRFWRVRHRFLLISIWLHSLILTRAFTIVKGNDLSIRPEANVVYRNHADDNAAIEVYCYRPASDVGERRDHLLFGHRYW